MEAARVAKLVVEARLGEQLPARRESAQAALAQAQAELDKTVVRAGVLVPEDRGLRRVGLAAGIGQIEGQVIRPACWPRRHAHRNPGPSSRWW